MATPDATPDTSADDGVTVYGFLLNDTIAGDLSPFCTKLETFLKMTKTEYKFVDINDHMLSGSPKGKMPWIHAPKILGDEKIGDSSIIIDALIAADPDTYDVDKHLSDEEKAIGRAFKVMVEESSYWFTVYLRWVPESKPVTVPAFFPSFHWSVQSMCGWYLNRNIQAQLKGQGTGLLSDEEITAKAKAETKALSDFLGTKKYFMGDKISSYDATIYSFVSPSVLGDWKHPICDAAKEHQNLVDYVGRMRKEFWS